MDQSLYITNINNKPRESTSSDRMEIPPEMKSNSVKHESDCLLQSEIYIKTELQEDEKEYPERATTFYELCPNYNMTIEMEEPLIEIKCSGLENEILQDPLDVGTEIQDEEHAPINLDGESNIKTEPIEEGKDVSLLKTNQDNLHGSRSNQGQDHVLIKTDSNHKDKKYICNVCNKAFRQKGDLVQHFRIHTGEKPYTCDICNRSFKFRNNLTSHMFIHSGEKPYACDVCQKVFSRKSVRNDHMLIHSGAKPFPCKECGKSFSQKNNLTRHKRLHTGDKPYTCDVCRRAFTDISSLVQHRRLHTGEKPFTCDICNRSFVQKVNLNRHKKTHKNL